MSKNYFKNRRPEDIHNQLLALKELMTFFKKECNVWSYLIYGTLLGSVREQNVIANDTDYDIALLISGDTIEEVKNNFYKIGKILIDKKMLRKVWTREKRNGIINPTNINQLKNPLGQMHVMTPDRALLIDIWVSWFYKDKYYLTRGVKGELNKNDILPFQHSFMRDMSFVIPNKSEKILCHVYGNDWKIPQIKKSNGQNFTMKNIK